VTVALLNETKLEGEIAALVMFDIPAILLSKSYDTEHNTLGVVNVIAASTAFKGISSVVI
jgi:hypothetical protein